MLKNKVIPFDHFADAFSRVGWNRHTSSTGRYAIWIDPKNQENWTRLPINIEDPDYVVYQKKNELILLFALNLPEDFQNVSEISSQLKAYNYKLINRIVGTNTIGSETIPFELASVIPEKNVQAFRYFYSTKSKKRNPLPIEKFEFNHTEEGSFIIPVSIYVDKPQPTIYPIATETNVYLHQYLKAIDELVKLPKRNEVEFADRVLGESIDSKIVRDFFGRGESIARYKEKYSDRISAITIGSKGSSLLDFGLSVEEREFQMVDLGSAEPLKESFLDVLEEREIAADETTLEERSAKITVLVESIDILGKAKYTVLSINGHKIERPFKAKSGDITKDRLDHFADHFKSSQTLNLIGDIRKSKGKLGTIVVGQVENEIERPTLFDDPDY